MKKQFPLMWGAAMTLLLTGCIDNNYDLSDIDTTTEIKVKDLVLPINLEPVVLSDIIELKEGDDLKEVTINGNTFYAVETSGEFSSDGIDVNPFEAFPDDMENKIASFMPASMRGAKGKRNAGTDGKLYLLIKEVINKELEYEATDIDGSIRGLNAINFDEMTIKMTLSAPGLPSGVNAKMENVQLQIPNGLVLKKIQAGKTFYDPSVYNHENGYLTLTQPFEFTDKAATIEIVAESIDLEGYSSTFTYDEKSNKGSLKLHSEFNLLKANLELTGNLAMLGAADQIDFNVGYELGDLRATSIVGAITYDLSGTGLDIQPVNLENLPDFLDEKGTNLILANPQIYLNLKNPIGHYGLGYQSIIEVVAQRDSESKTFTSPVVKVPNQTGNHNFMLAPRPSDVMDVPADYKDDLTRLEYNNLGSLLEGDGLPKFIDIKLVKPNIPVQTVSVPFELGQSIEGMEGTYMFLAPLSLQEGSEIVKTIDGWWDEDLEHLTINVLSLSAVASSDLSMGVKIQVYPIDKDGKRIESSTEATVDLPANAMNLPIELTMEGEIKNLDGVKIFVFATDDDEEPLAPDQSILLENLKIKVSGNYTKEF